jgi:uncharacterized protein YuzE
MIRLTGIYQTFLLIFLLILTWCCTNKTETKREKNNSIIAPLKKPPSSYQDTFVILNKAVVFYRPDSLQLEKIRQLNKAPIFESMQHDCYYQMRHAATILKLYFPGITVNETNKARYLLFITAGNDKIYIDLDQQGDMCGIFLFDEVNQPMLADMMNIDTQLASYFND